MSEDTTAEAGEHDENGETEEKEFEAITSQDDLDRIIQKRLDRERSKFADYDDLKTKAERLEQVEKANQTEEERRQEEHETALFRASEAEKKLLRMEIATEVELPAKATKFLTGETEEEIRASAAELKELFPESAQGTGSKINPGQRAKDVADPLEAQARQIFGLQ